VEGRQEVEMIFDGRILDESSYFPLKQRLRNWMHTDELYLRLLLPFHSIAVG
jgi:hypothetical protein